jgi:hypothetical protein
MTQTTSKIKLEERRNQIKIERKPPSDIFSGKLHPKKWEQFCDDVDEALRIICRARSRSRVLDVVHVMIAIILIIAQIVVYIGKGTTIFKTKVYEYFCDDGENQEFVCNWFRSDLSWIPIFFISYVVWAIVHLFLIRRCIFKRSQRVFIERIKELCTQLSKICPTWDFQLCLWGFSCFNSIRFCTIKVERAIPSIETGINMIQKDHQPEP